MRRGDRNERVFSQIDKSVVYLTGMFCIILIWLSVPSSQCIILVVDNRLMTLVSPDGKLMRYSNRLVLPDILFSIQSDENFT